MPPSPEGDDSPLPAPWQERLLALQIQGMASPEPILALEAEGASPDALTSAIARLYRPEWFLRRCIQVDGVEPDAAGDQRLGRSSWALEILEHPGAVLACWGHSILDVFAYRVANLPPERWLEGRIEPGVDLEVLKAVTSEGFTFQTPSRALDLTWIRREVRGNLVILNPMGLVHLPHLLRCRDRFGLRGAARVTRLHGIRVKGDTGLAVIEDCPDLVDLELPRATTVEIRRCPSLRRIRGNVPSRNLRVDGCPRLQQAVLCFPKDTLSRPRVAFRNCPSLIQLESTSRARRVIGDLILVSCPSLRFPLPPLVVTGRVNIGG